MSYSKFGILVLAAGQSRRFGSDKLLARLHDGRTVLEHSLQPLQAISRQYKTPLQVITRSNNLPLIKLLTDLNIDYSISKNAHLGMGHSIADGVQENKDWQGWLIALADMPNLHEHFLKNMFQSIKSNLETIIRPQVVIDNRTVPTHPVYFPKKYQQQLCQLKGDQGAKGIIKDNDILVFIDDENLNRESIIDLDTKELLQQAINNKSVSN